ncbi:Aste57867_17008 [Aphanomyces stellatus]|uniref:Aste57867_17008 protein n=1 Tax=Aphanomyces stellatus TaxID=120398 RepID=A0A485L7I5_9STRA|nr:hypothetical protein As57867_016950 [Aphanomyces stellatus]VFT93769.1 Aste57867_17008 [Aphanomyces stellatus]
MTRSFSLIVLTPGHEQNRLSALASQPSLSSPLPILRSPSTLYTGASMTTSLHPSDVERNEDVNSRASSPPASRVTMVVWGIVALLVLALGGATTYLVLRQDSPSSSSGVARPSTPPTTIPPYSSSSSTIIRPTSTTAGSNSSKGHLLRHLT